MFNTKLISIRVDEQMVDFIDRWCANKKYYNRSVVINCILRAGIYAALMNNGEAIQEHVDLYNIRFKID